MIGIIIEELSNESFICIVTLEDILLLPNFSALLLLLFKSCLVILAIRLDLSHFYELPRRVSLFCGCHKTKFKFHFSANSSHARFAA